MAQSKFGAQTEGRSRAGPIIARRLIGMAVVAAAALGLAACAGPYEDTYPQPRTEYQSGPNYYYDNRYEQRRRSAYPYASPDHRRRSSNWWLGADHSHDRYSHEHER